MKNMRNILPYVKGYKKRIALFIFINAISIALSLITFGMMMPFIGVLFGKVNEVKKTGPLKFNINSILEHAYIFIQKQTAEHGIWQTLIIICTSILILTLLRSTFRYWGLYILTPVRNGIVRDIRNKIFHSVLQLHVGFFSKENNGDILSRMTSDVQEIEASVIRSIHAFLRNPVLIILTLISLFFISFELSIVIVFAFPAISYIVHFLGRKLKRSSKAGQVSYGRLVSIIEETIYGMRIIKTFNRQTEQEHYFSNQNEEYTGLMNRVWRKKSIAGPLSELLITIVLIVIMLYGGFMIAKNNGQGTLRPEVFMGYIVMFMRLNNPTRVLMIAYYDIQKGLASIERVNELLSVKSEIVECENPTEVESFSSSIEIKNIYFKHGTTDILKNISFSIPKGKTIAIVGQSGSGKSTIADLLSRYYDPQEGQIFFDGIDIKNIRLHSLRNQIGYITQEPVLFNETIENNILMGREGCTIDDVRNAAEVANAHMFIENLEHGYQTNVSDRGMKLSGGEKQRISIARTILKNPPIIIMDEATSSLDSESEKLVLDAMHKIMENRTTLIIAHRLSTIVHADEILVLQDGEIISRGTHTELLDRSPYYKRIFEMQNNS